MPTRRAWPRARRTLHDHRGIHTTEMSASGSQKGVWITICCKYHSHALPECGLSCICISLIRSLFCPVQAVLAASCITYAMSDQTNIVNWLLMSTSEWYHDHSSTTHSKAQLRGHKWGVWWRLEWEDWKTQTQGLLKVLELQFVPRPEERQFIWRPTLRTCHECVYFIYSSIAG